MLLALISVLLVAEPGRTWTPAPSAALTPKERAFKVALIDEELRRLKDVPTAGGVFQNTMVKIFPYWAIGTVPLAAIGVVLGLGHNTITFDTTDNGLLARSIGVSLIIIGITSAIALSLGLMTVIDHWFDEAGEAPKREARRSELLEQRARLEKVPAE